MMLRKALLILSGGAATALLTLLRNLLVAWLIPVGDFGIAATFALVMAAAEMATAFGLQQQIVQSKDGDDPHFQAVLQAFQLLRAVTSSAILFLLAGPLAAFLGIPEVVWAYQLLAVVPTLNALTHFDIYRQMRQLRFLPEILTTTVPALVGLVVVWPLVLILGDWRVMVGVILLQSVVQVTVSHLMAERPWRLAFDRQIMLGSLKFGWPILANALLLFIVFQGDKLIVGREMGMETLGIFAMGLTLTFGPISLLSGVAIKFYLPQLSTPDLAPERLAQLRLVLVQGFILITAVVIALGAVLGGPIVQVLLGEKYLPLTLLIGWLIIAQAIRLLKIGPAIIALATGHTVDTLVANLVRGAAFPLIWHVAATSGDLILVLWIVAGAEAAGQLLSLAFLARRGQIGLRRLVLPHLILVGVVIFAASHLLLTPSEDLARVAGPTTVFGLLVLLGALVGTMPELRLYLLHRRRAS